MIETIYSNENGEGNQTNRVQSTFKMPKNIRQIGKSSATKKIYVEDYVMTFIKQLSGEDYSKCKAAVLVGQYVKNETCRNIFISGAIEVDDIDTTNDIIFSNDAWTGIYDKIKNYFIDSEIVGWFIGGPGYLLEEKEKITKAHVDNFAGQDKTLLTFDNMEKEETFLIYENGHLNKQEGYYIYYEKNEEMQTYMIDHKNIQSDEATFDDKISREIRTVIQNKKPATEENKSVTRLMYAAGTLLAVIILIVGAAMLGNYDQMKNMQSAINSLSKNLEEVENIFAEDKSTPTVADVHNENAPVTEKDSATDIQDGSLDVEIVPGNVEPLDDNDEDEKDTTSEEDLAEQNQDKEEKPQKEEDAEQNSEEQDSQNEVEKIKYYTVKAGDSLIGISLKLYNSANYMTKIMELNNITDQDVIYIGQRLIVP